MYAYSQPVRRLGRFSTGVPTGTLGCAGDCPCSRQRRRRPLGDAASLWTGVTQNSLNPFVFLPADYVYLTQPDPSLLASPSLDTFSNMAYGALTAGQVGQLKQQAAQSITQAAAGNADLAQQQIAMANANIDSVVNANGGVAPSLANVTAPDGSILGLPWYVWAVLAIPAVYLLYKAVR